MKIDIRPRLSGKTHDLLQKSEALLAPIIVSNRRDVERLLDTAKRSNIHIPCPLPVYDVVRKFHVDGVPQGILIDDLDRVLWQIFGTQVIEATLTEESHSFSVEVGKHPIIDGEEW